MPSLGPAEILVVLVIALLVFGPNKMPDIARQVGKGFREFKRVQQHLKSELRDVVSEFDSTVVDAVGSGSRPGPDAAAEGRTVRGADAPGRGRAVRHRTRSPTPPCATRRLDRPRGTAAGPEPDAAAAEPA